MWIPTNNFNADSAFDKVFATRTAFPLLNAYLAGRSLFSEYVQLSNMKISAAYAAFVPWNEYLFDFQNKTEQRLSEELQ